MAPSNLFTVTIYGLTFVLSSLVIISAEWFPSFVLSNLPLLIGVAFDLQLDRPRLSTVSHLAYAFPNQPLWHVHSLHGARLKLLIP
jgi:hypothetical protein